MLRPDYLAFFAALLILSCSAPKPTDPPTSSIALPAIEDAELRVHAAMGAVGWAKLEPDDREIWTIVWDTAIAIDEAPEQLYEAVNADGEPVQRNLFTRSARDGYCVAFAHYQAGRLAPDNVCVSFLSHTAR